MQCRHFRRTIHHYLDDSFSDRVKHNFWEHGRTCDKCAFQLMWRFLGKDLVFLRSTKRLTASLAFNTSVDGTRIPVKKIEKFVVRFKYVFIQLLIIQWRKEYLSVDKLKEYCIVASKTLAQPAEDDNHL